MDWDEPLQQFSDLVERFNDLLPGMVVGVLLFCVFVLVARAGAWLTRRAADRQRRHRSLGLALSRVTEWAVIAIGFLMSATVAFPTFTPGNLISTLGITSIAIGFAFRDILENFLAGILILATEPFRVNDQIVFDVYEGTVEDIQTRATTIRTYDGRRVVIPNAKLFTNAVTINTAYDARQLHYDIGIGAGDDIGRARSVILETLRGIDGVLADPQPDVLVVALAQNNPLLRVRWWIRPPRWADAIEVQDQVLRAIKSALATQGIGLPIPAQQMSAQDQSKVSAENGADK